jgi:hypothetical protein
MGTTGEVLNDVLKAREIVKKYPVGVLQTAATVDKLLWQKSPLMIANATWRRGRYAIIRFITRGIFPVNRNIIVRGQSSSSTNGRSNGDRYLMEP